MTSRQNAPVYAPDSYPPFGENPNRACKDHPAQWWFPNNSGFEAQTTKDAKRICRKCPLLEECREWAIPKPWTDGIWGGLTLHERAYERRARAAAARIRKANT